MKVFKQNGKKGFTLAELLIVVAIIAVLVAIMVPVFGSSKDKSILAKDTANLRSAYAEAVVTAMTGADGDSALDALGTSNTKLAVLVEVPSGFQCAVKVENGTTVKVQSPKKNEMSFEIDKDVVLSFGTAGTDTIGTWQ